MGCSESEAMAERYLARLRMVESDENKSMELKATWDTSYVNSLPDSSFLHVESGGKKDDQGKTVPRSLRHLPYKDAGGNVDLSHLRNAISRLGQPNTGKGWLSSSLRASLTKKAQAILKRHSKEMIMDEEIQKESDSEVLPTPEDHVQKEMQSGSDEKMALYSGARNFDEMEAQEEAVQKMMNVDKTLHAVPMFGKSIMYSEDEDKPGMIAKMLDQAKERVMGMFSKEDMADEMPEETEEEMKEIEDNSSLMITKNANGDYVWIARYSNNVRDIDNPPEIISAASHRRFVELVDKGVYPMPELWIWHMKELKIGQATIVDFDEETGFAIAAGYIDKDKHEIAESLASIDANLLRVSHGMPIENIVRSKEDPTIIIEHQTKEISPLPALAAANPLTGFTMSQKENTMLDSKKVQGLADLGIPQVQIESVVAANQADKETAEKLHLETKAVEEETEVQAEEATEEAPEVTEPEAEPEADAEPVAEETALTVEDVSEAIKAVVQPLVVVVQDLQAQVKELQTADEEKIAKEIAVTPREALFASLGSIIGNQEAQVDGRTKEGKEGPKETPVEKEGNSIGVTFLNDLDNWRGSFEDLSQ